MNPNYAATHKPFSNGHRVCVNRTYYVVAWYSPESDTYTLRNRRSATYREVPAATIGYDEK